MKNNNLKNRLFEEICNLYSHDLQRFIYGLTRKDQVAMEEIFQNTMIKALEGLGGLRETDVMKTWIFAIAKGEAKRYYARKKNHESYALSENLGEALFEAAGEKDFTKVVEDRELIRALVGKLSEEEQQIYLLHYSYDLPLKEVSEILHMNYSTVRNMHVRGIHKLQRFLGKGAVIWIMTLINMMKY
jgi:RNA polymerase sigma-70 factor (ECF subfamily)